MRASVRVEQRRPTDRTDGIVFTNNHDDDWLILFGVGNGVQEGSNNSSSGSGGGGGGETLTHFAALFT